MKRYRYSSGDSPGVIIALFVLVIALNLALLAGAVAIIVLVLRALGVL